MEIKNVRVYGLEESRVRSGYPKALIGEVPNMNNMGHSLDRLEKDEQRIKKLANTPVGSGHDTALKGIIVQFDIKYPEYFSPQLQRYSHIDIISSQSKMHKLTSIKEFTNDMFSRPVMGGVLDGLNYTLQFYKDANNKEDKLEAELDLYSDLPGGFMKWMGISTNYLQLKTIYNQRKKHKLPEWKYFCDWIKTLPSSELIIN